MTNPAAEKHIRIIGPSRGAMSWDTAQSFTIGVLGTPDTYIVSDCRLENVVRTPAQIKAAYRTGAFGV